MRGERVHHKFCGMQGIKLNGNAMKTKATGTISPMK